MASRITDPLYGWLVPDLGVFSGDRIADNTATVLTSDYAETSPRPGQAEIVTGIGRAALAMRRAQTEQVQVLTRTGGMPGQQGAAVAVAGSNDVYYGWSGHMINELEVVTSTALASYDVTAICARATTGYPIVGYVETGGTTWECKYWDGSAWQAATGESASGALALALVALPEGRVLAIGWDDSTLSVDYSDDGGATWSPYSRSALVGGTPGGTVSRMVAAYTEGQIILVMEETGGTAEIYQFASADLGATFNLVNTATVASSIQVASLPAGGFAVAGENLSGEVVVGIIGAATDYITTNVVTVYSGATTGFDDLCLWATETGGIYVLAVKSDDWYMLRSLDYLQTVMEVGQIAEWVDVTTPTTFRRLVACNTYRGAYVLLQWTAPSYAGPFDDQVYALRIGGYDTLVRAWSYTDSGVSATAVSPKGANHFGDPDSNGWLYLGTETLQNHGFTKAGAGSEAVGPAYTNATGVISLTLSGKTRNIDTYQYIDVAVNAGGSVATANQFFEMVFGDTSTEDYHYRLRVGPSNWRLTDSNNAAATLASGSATMSEGLVFCVGVDVIYYRARGAIAWSKATFSSTDGGGAASVFFSYESTNATADVEIRMLAFRDHNSPDLITLRDSETGANAYDGRPISSLPMWLPVGGTGAQLAMVDGPSAILDSWTIDPVYDYAVINALPDQDPSPAAEWRSGVETEQILTFEPDYDPAGGWFGVYVQRPRFRAAHLEIRSGGSWSEILEIDCAEGLTALDFVRTTGSHELVPATTPATDAGRYIQAGELVGGYVAFATGACREIVANTAGSWAAASSGSPRPTIRIDGDDTEPTSGSMVIVPPQAFAIGYTSLRGVKYRLRIPAQNVLGDSIGAGILYCGRLHLSGAEPDWGWSESVDLSVERYTTPYGTPYATEIGPPRIVWSWSWSDGVDLFGVRDSLNVDYLGPTLSGGGTNALAADGDVWWQVRGLYDLTASGTRPCVAIRQWPAEGTTINDPTRMLYGYLDPGGYTVSGLLGTEGSSEAVRVGTVVMREIV